MMTWDEYSRLRYGTMVMVRFGSRGTQMAKIVGVPKTGKHGQYRKVERWRAKSGKWTKPAACYVEEVISLAP